MNQLWNRPQIAQVQIDDAFWTPYLSGIRHIMLPYTFAKFEETGYVEFDATGKKIKEKCPATGEIWNYKYSYIGTAVNE